MKYLEYNFDYSLVSSVLVVGNRYEEKEILISIVIPTYNRFDLMLNALSSAINQNNIYNVNYEIIVVDNNPENIDNQRVKNLKNEIHFPNFGYYINNENIGMMANWNRGIELALGDWVVLLHDDDYFLDNYISTMFLNIKRFKKADCIAHLPFVHDKRKIKELNINLNDKPTYKKLDSEFMITNNFHISGSLIKKETVYDLGGFNSEMYPISDYDFNERLIRKYSVFLVYNAPLVVIVFQENETLKARVFEKWFEAERNIKINAISKYNKFLRYIYKKIIDVEINNNISIVVNDYMTSDEDKKFVEKNRLSVTSFSQILWYYYIKYWLFRNKLFERTY